MMTIVTHVSLREGAGREWDAAMRTRLSAAKKATGWVGGQLLRPPDKPETRVIVGTWRARANWESSIELEVSIRNPGRGRGWWKLGMRNSP